jgi:cytochrome c556
MQHRGGVLLALLGVATVAPAQGPAKLEGQGWTGLTQPGKVIEARRLLMNEAERQIKPIDEFTLGGTADLAALRSAAVTIEPILLALPHLFPPTTNVYDPSELESPTIALPAIWEDFETFQQLTEAAEVAAVAVATAADAEALKAAARTLRGACDSCHAAFMKPYTPSQATDADREFDFDSALGK